MRQNPVKQRRLLSEAPGDETATNACVSCGGELAIKPIRITQTTAKHPKSARARYRHRQGSARAAAGWRREDGRVYPQRRG